MEGTSPSPDLALIAFRMSYEVDYITILPSLTDQI